MWNFVYRVRSIFTSRQELCARPSERNSLIPAYKTTEGGVSHLGDSGIPFISMCIYVLTLTDGYLTDTTADFCFCVFVFVWKCLYKPGKLVVFQTTKHWMHLGKDMFETPQWQQIVLPLIFYFRDYFFFLVIAVSFIDKANSLLFISFCVPGYPLKSGMSCVFIWGTLQWLSLHFVLSKLFHTLCFP